MQSLTEQVRENSRRQRFVEQLKTMNLREAKHLLEIESDDELREIAKVARSGDIFRTIEFVLMERVETKNARLLFGAMGLKGVL